jgi:FKBP12-rapamycin complex-associated protein
LGDIFALIKDFWVADSPLQPTLIGLVENISDALGAEFKSHVPCLVPPMVRVLSYDISPQRNITFILLNALKKFGGSMNDYIHLLLPRIVVLFDSTDVPMKVRQAALECVESLSESIDFSEYASLLVHPLGRTLDSTPELRTKAMDTLAAVVSQLGKKYAIFVSMVQKVLLRHQISHQRYDILCARIAEGGNMGDFDDYVRPRTRKRGGAAGGGEQLQPTSAALDGARRLPRAANLANLEAAWQVTQRVSKDDWLDWYGRLCSELLKASPSPALRACWTVAQRLDQLAKDLFNASFVSCWSELEATQQVAETKGHPYLFPEDFTITVLLFVVCV